MIRHQVNRFKDWWRNETERDGKGFAIFMVVTSTIIGTMVVGFVIAILQVFFYHFLWREVIMNASVVANIAWPLAIFGIIAIVCFSILLANKRERDNERYKAELQIRMAELEAVDKSEARKQEVEIQTLRRQSRELEKEIESIRNFGPERYQERKATS